MQPEPHQHSHLFIPLLHDYGALSAAECEDAVAHLSKKRACVIPWIKAARDAGVIERDGAADERDAGGWPSARRYRLTVAGQELVPDLIRLQQFDAEFLTRLEEFGPGQTAETLSAQHSDLATEFVELWVESAYGRGLIYPTERGEPMRFQLTDAGRVRLGDVAL